MRCRFPLISSLAADRRCRRPRRRRRAAPRGIRGRSGRRAGARRAHRQDRARRGRRRQRRAASPRSSRSATAWSPPRARPRRPETRRASPSATSSEAYQQVGRPRSRLALLAHRRSANPARVARRLLPRRLGARRQEGGGAPGRRRTRSTTASRPRSTRSPARRATTSFAARTTASRDQPFVANVGDLALVCNGDTGEHDNTEPPDWRGSPDDPSMRVPAYWHGKLQRHGFAARIAAVPKIAQKASWNPIHITLGELLLGDPRREVEIPRGQLRAVRTCSSGRISAAGAGTFPSRTSSRSSSRCRRDWRGATSCRPGTTRG